MLPPPARPASEIVWCGARNGRSQSRPLPGRRRPATEWIWVASIATVNVSGGKIPGSERYVRFGKKGMSDIQGYLDDGRALYVECKSATGKLRPEQVAFLERAERCGCKVVLARSVDDLIAAGL